MNGFVSIPGLPTAHLGVRPGFAAWRVDTHRPAAASFVLDTGGTGEPVVLLAATPGGARSWRDQIEMLRRQGHRVLLYAVGTQRPAQAGEALGTALQRHGVSRAHLVAQGSAALQAWELAVSHARWFRSLSVVGAGHADALVDQLLADHPLWGLERWPSVLSRVLGRRLKGLVKARSGLLRPAAEAREDRLGEIAEWAAQLARIKAARQPIGPIALPTLAVHVENDALSCERALLLSGLRVSAEWRFERIGAGLRSAPAQHRCVNELLRRWFAVARTA
jgi:pimeloyl-ACP methyl ester carboxylesterase